MDWGIILTSTVFATVISAIASWITASLTIKSNREKLRREFQLQYATEAAIKTLLETEKYEMRSFTKIQHHLSGFADPNELRRHIIAAGGVRFKDTGDNEMWGLLEKHKGEAFR